MFEVGYSTFVLMIVCTLKIQKQDVQLSPMTSDISLYY